LKLTVAIRPGSCVCDGGASKNFVASLFLCPFAPAPLTFGLPEDRLGDGDMNLEEALERIEGDTTDIKAALAGQTDLLETDRKLLREILAAVTPEEGADGGVPLNELLAELIMELRDQVGKLSRVLDILTSGQPGRRGAADLATLANSMPRGGRP
jgi:hypothetical protein